MTGTAGSSGIVLYYGKVIIISDNLPGYIIMDTATLHDSFYSFRPGIMPAAQDKAVKEDLENADKIILLNKPYLVAFGSGSVEKTREKALYFHADTLQKCVIVNVNAFYNSIKQQLNINTAQLNIEGSFSTADSFYLLNRGTNQLIAMELSVLEQLLTSGIFPSATLNTRAYSMPLLDSFPISFSGACYFKDDKFLFTATVEKTADWVADGEIAGSWIGMAGLDGSISFLLPLVDEKGNFIKQKLESVDVIKEHSNGDISLYAISDNDNGQSTWFTLLLTKE